MIYVNKCKILVLICEVKPIQIHECNKQKSYSKVNKSKYIMLKKLDLQVRLLGSICSYITFYQNLNNSTH